MKTSFKTLLALAGFGATALISQAQTAPKILVLDVGKAFQAHYKAAEMDESLKSDAQKVDGKLKSFQKEIEDLAAKYKESEEQAKNPALTKEAQEKVMGELEKLGQTIQAKQQEGQNYLNTSRRDLSEKQQNMTNFLIEDITKKGAEIGKRKGADLVLPKNNLVYNNPAWDITDEVIAEINKDKPAGTPAKPAAAPAAPAAKPADGAPSVVFPGAKK